MPATRIEGYYLISPVIVSVTTMAWPLASDTFKRNSSVRSVFILAIFYLNLAICSLLFPYQFGNSFLCMLVTDPATWKMLYSGCKRFIYFCSTFITSSGLQYSRISCVFFFAKKKETKVRMSVLYKSTINRNILCF